MLREVHNLPLLVEWLLLFNDCLLLQHSLPHYGVCLLMSIDTIVES